MVRELRDLSPDAAEARLRADGLDVNAASNLRRYLEEQGESTGSVPDDRTIVVERFPDEIGDWRICILTPFGSRVHAPWALALEERHARRHARDPWSDIICPPGAIEDIPPDLLLFEPDEVEELVVERLP
jgi:ATP-dependent Lhr-like helicase